MCASIRLAADFKGCYGGPQPIYTQAGKILFPLCEAVWAEQIPDFYLILGTRAMVLIVSVLYYTLKDYTRFYKHGRGNIIENGWLNTLIFSKKNWEINSV